MIKNSKIFSAHDGIALVLSVLILANLMMITLIVADVILRIGKTSREIGESEAAYYAAESVIEEAIYKIEKEYNASDLGTESSPTVGTLSSPNITWQRYVKPIVSTPVVCIDNNNITTTYSTFSAVVNPDVKSCIYTDSPGDITKSNPLNIKLHGKKSFELDFNIAVPEGVIFYPSSIDINWAKSTPGSLIVLNSSGQTVIDTSPSPSQYQTDPLTSSPNLRLRFINDGFEEATYTIAPHNTPPAEFLPMTIEIVAKGYHNGQKERIIVVDKKLWKIY